MVLDVIRRTADERLLWDNVAGQVTAGLKGGRCCVEAAVLSPLSSTLRRAPRPVASSASEFARLAQYTPLTKRVSLAASTKVDETIAASLRAYGPWRQTEQHKRGSWRPLPTTDRAHVRLFLEAALAYAFLRRILRRD